MNKLAQPQQSLKKPPPTQEEMWSRVQSARKALEVAFKDFHVLLSDKTLATQCSAARKKHEKHIMDTLAKACTSLEDAKVGEGFMAMGIIALREHLQVRDRVNELEYELELSKREIKKLKKELGK